MAGPGIEPWNAASLVRSSVTTELTQAKPTVQTTTSSFIARKITPVTFSDWQCFVNFIIFNLTLTALQQFEQKF